RLVEAMNLVDEKNCLSSELESLFGRSDNLSNSRNTFSHGRKRDELAISVTRDHPSDCRLARSRRAPEHHRRDRAFFDCISQWFPYPDEVLLSNDFIECSWTHSRSQRLRR